MRRCFLILTFVLLVCLAQTTEARKRALLVGVDDYENVQSLRCCVNDMNTLKEALMKIGFEENDIQILVTGGAFRNLPTKKKIEQKLSELLSSADDEDLVFIAFSGHGAQNASGVFFCPPDVDLRDLEGTCVSITKVMNDVAKCNAKFKWVVVDACRNDPASSRDARGLQVVPTPPKGIALFQSCAEGEKSYEERGGGNGYFTKNFAAALSGEADTDYDGKLTLMEVCKWTTAHTKSDVLKAEKVTQRPFFSGSITDFTLTEDLNVPKAKAFIEEAQKAMDAKNFTLAIEKYDAAIALCPRFESWKRERKLAQQMKELSQNPPTGSGSVSDILINPPLTWSINAIRVEWSIDPEYPRLTRYLCGNDPNYVESEDPLNNTMFFILLPDGTHTDDVLSRRVNKHTNPITRFGLYGSKVSASFYLEGEFDYNQNQVYHPLHWSNVEKTFVNQVLTSVFAQGSFDQRLIITIDFVNHSGTRLFFNSDSDNEIAVYSGNVLIGKARLIGDENSIAPTGQPFPFQFEMTLNEKAKQLLAESRPVIHVESSLLKVHSSPQDQKNIQDAVQESTSNSNFFTVSVLAGNVVKEWKIRWFNNNPITLQKALESINEKVCSQNNINKSVFNIKDGRFVSVCDVLFSEGAPGWVAELKVFKEKGFQKVTTPDSYLSKTPGRGERYVFHLVSQKIRNLQRYGKAGDAESALELAKRYDTGDCVPEDKVRSLVLLQIAAKSGDVNAQSYFGRCYHYGNGVVKSYSEALRWYRKAAEKGNPSAQNNTGYAYYKGLGVPVNHDEAIKWYRKSAEQGQEVAQVNLAACYYKGIGVAQNYDEAVKWYRKSAEQGFPPALNSLGYCYECGHGVPVDEEEAVKLYRKAAEKGYEMGQCNLGSCYYAGFGVPVDYVEAMKWFRLSANQGNAAAQYHLGVCYYEGKGVAVNYEKALLWLRKAAAQNDAAAYYLLGLCYMSGDGVPQSNAEAISMWHKSAELGFKNAQYHLGVCYFFGKGIKEDFIEAVKWWRKAAEQGHPNAQYNLAMAYQKGIGGLPKDYEEAVKWFRKAAVQGDATSQCSLGTCLFLGEGVRKNIPEAVQWWRKAAEQGEPIAQNNMGVCYEKGIGVRKNRAEAVRWYRKAAVQGYEDAISALKGLNETFD